MKSNRFKNKEKEQLISEDMPNGWLVVGIIAFLLFLLYPVQQVLTLQMKISENTPPQPEDIQVIKEKLSYASYLTRQTLQTNIIGDTKVKIIVKNPSGITVFNQSYFLSAGTFAIKTPSKIDSGYGIDISISKFNYQRSISIG